MFIHSFIIVLFVINDSFAQVTVVVDWNGRNHSSYVVMQHVDLLYSFLTTILVIVLNMVG